MDPAPALAAIERELADVRAACSRLALSVPVPDLPVFDKRVYYKTLVRAAGRVILRSLRARKAVRVLYAKRSLRDGVDAVLGFGPFYRGPGQGREELVADLRENSSSKTSFAQAYYCARLCCVAVAKLRRNAGCALRARWSGRGCGSGNGGVEEQNERGTRKEDKKQFGVELKAEPKTRKRRAPDDDLLFELSD